MASGDRSLRLTEHVTWEDFAPYACAIVRVLGGSIDIWSRHPSFPREHDLAYYDAACTRLHDLAFLLFVGESPYEDPAAFDAPL